MEVYSNKILSQESRKPKLNRKPNFTTKTTGKRRRRKKKNLKFLEGKKS